MLYSIEDSDDLITFESFFKLLLEVHTHEMLHGLSMKGWKSHLINARGNSLSSRQTMYCILQTSEIFNELRQRHKQKDNNKKKKTTN